MVQQQQYSTVTSFHGTSASFSSTFSTSRLSGSSSTSSSSSFSSPSSSPPFFNSFLLNNINTDLASPFPSHLNPNSNPNPHCTIPFLWEEKPGVTKKNQNQESRDQNSSELSPMYSDRTNKRPFNSKVSKASRLDPIRHSYSFKTNDDFSDYRFSTDTESYGYNFHNNNNKNNNKQDNNPPRLRPPPRLQNSSAKPTNPRSTGFIRRRRIHGGRSSSVSLDDDPFWRAMVACSTEDLSKLNTKSTGNSNTSSSSSSLANPNNQTEDQHRAGLSKQPLHFEQCMPRRRHHSCENPATCTSSSSKTIPLDPNFNTVQKHRNASIEHSKSKHEKPPLPAASMASSENIKQPQHKNQQMFSSAGNNSNVNKESHSQINPTGRHRRNRSNNTADIVQTVPVDLSCGFAARRKAMVKSSRLFPDLFGCRPTTQNWQ